MSSEQWWWVCNKSPSELLRVPSQRRRCQFLVEWRCGKGSQTLWQQVPQPVRGGTVGNVPDLSLPHLCLLVACILESINRAWHWRKISGSQEAGWSDMLTHCASLKWTALCQWLPVAGQTALPSGWSAQQHSAMSTPPDISNPTFTAHGFSHCAPGGQAS